MMIFFKEFMIEFPGFQSTLLKGYGHQQKCDYPISNLG
jgi:hypothetical protein